MLDLNSLTWTCHVCGEKRPDDKISVHSKDDSAKYDLPPGTIKTNVRYCNDKQSCIEGAKTYEFIGEPK